MSATIKLSENSLQAPAHREALSKQLQDNPNLSQSFRHVLNLPVEKGFINTFPNLMSQEINGFLKRAHSTEHRIKQYTEGKEAIENIAPLVSQLNLEVEAFARVIETLSTVPKTLLAIQM